jgi:hypothetical protein
MLAAVLLVLFVALFGPVIVAAASTAVLSPDSKGVTAAADQAQFEDAISIGLDSSSCSLIDTNEEEEDATIVASNNSSFSTFSDSVIQVPSQCLSQRTRSKRGLASLRQQPKTNIFCSKRRKKTKIGRLMKNLADAVQRKNRIDREKVLQSRDRNSFGSGVSSKRHSDLIDEAIVIQWNIGDIGLSKEDKRLFHGLSLKELLAKNDFFREAWLDRLQRARVEAAVVACVTQSSRSLITDP